MDNQDIAADKFAITTPGIDLRTLKPGCVIVATCAQVLRPVERAKAILQLRQTLANAGMPKEVVVLMVRPGDSLELLDERQMNHAGWFRAGTAPGLVDIGSPLAPIKLVEIDIGPDGKRFWVNIDGKCAVRVCTIERLVVTGDRANFIFLDKNG